MIKKLSGFTLTELIVTISIFSILTALALPSFAGLMKRNELTAQINQMIVALNFVRTESIKRGVPITLCSSSDNALCATNSWNKRWLAFVDANANGVREDGEDIVRSFENQMKSARITTEYNDAVTYFPGGNSLNRETITFCTSKLIVKPKAVVINSVGRVYSSHKKADDTDLECSS